MVFFLGHGMRGDGRSMQLCLVGECGVLCLCHDKPGRISGSSAVQTNTRYKHNVTDMHTEGCSHRETLTMQHQHQQ